MFYGHAFPMNLFKNGALHTFPRGLDSPNLPLHFSRWGKKGHQVSDIKCSSEWAFDCRSSFNARGFKSFKSRDFDGLWSQCPIDLEFFSRAALALCITFPRLSSQANLAIWPYNSLVEVSKKSELTVLSFSIDEESTYRSCSPGTVVQPKLDEITKKML